MYINVPQNEWTIQPLPLVSVVLCTGIISIKAVDDCCTAYWLHREAPHLNFKQHGDLYLDTLDKTWQETCTGMHLSHDTALWEVLRQLLVMSTMDKYFMYFTSVLQVVIYMLYNSGVGMKF